MKDYDLKSFSYKGVSLTLDLLLLKYTEYLVRKYPLSKKEILAYFVFNGFALWHTKEAFQTPLTLKKTKSPK